LSQETNWIPCIFELASEVGKVVCTPHEVAVKENVSNLALTYTVPVPAIRGGRRLHLGGVTVGITMADAANSITKIQVRGVRSDTREVLWKDLNPHTSPQKLQQSFPPIDCSGWDALKVIVYVSSSNQPLLARIGFVSIQATYY